MLQTPANPRALIDARPASSAASDHLSISSLFLLARRRKAKLVGAIMLSLVLASVYLTVAPARYTAIAQLLTDTKRSDSPAAQYGLVDTAVVDSQVELLKSEKIAAAVVTKLKLNEDREFTDSGRLAQILASFGLADAEQPSSEEGRLRRAIAKFKRALSVVRIGRSYMANIVFTSIDANKAARIANEVADAYIEDQLDAKAASTERASSWMLKKVSELQQQSENAAQALNEFKAAHNGSEGSEPLEIDARTKLQELATAARNYRRFYETLLNLSKYSQGIEERTVPVTDARIVTWASPPFVASSPNLGSTLAIALLAGGSLGFMLAFVSELRDRGIRTRSQLEPALGVRCLASVPLVRSRHTSWMSFNPLMLIFKRPSGHGLVNLFEDRSKFGAAEALKNVQVAIKDRNKQSPKRLILGISSPRSGEGKTTLAFNLAVVISAASKRVLLVDGDLRGRVLSTALAPKCKLGISDFLKGSVAVEQATTETSFGFQFLGEPPSYSAPHPADLLISVQVSDRVRSLTNDYEYVVFDLPSVLEHIDVRACGDMFDAIILVAEYDRTTVDDLEQALTSSNAIADRAIGVIINKTPRGSH
jgi:polysaccharide biosynthesis transport protein